MDMKRIDHVGLKEVQSVYSGAEGRLWELIMGEQIHIGGLVSSTDLAQKAGIKAGSHGVDLCCCNGAGMRFLLRFQQVAHMTGVDATEIVVELGRKRCQDEGLADRAAFVLADVCQSGLPEKSADFVWGKDAWCYVVDKVTLVREAVRIVKPGGTIAFTDWVEGQGLGSSEGERFMKFMKFPSMFSVDDYKAEFLGAGCKVLHAEDTGRFGPYAALYLNMLQMQLTYDALKIIGFDQKAAEGLIGELAFAVELAKAGKIMQGLFVVTRS
jgi:SAM-dependent methyltransferase